ncbi:MAG TPA: VWA domain-containing protein [Cyanobacteria bacterium UBA11149]|nr:VWA domain-containing protein [Cyanobacteria bacterium UBA11367]HBE59067.1 VWA domain-containing protein [Cyanobacteria bacterium UBA11366]HBK66604.1 VWA domain-containing protein [Cyanobacteria bacterium UBA11166]HBR72747.1 VWA domain-containing protein [Cyanobacteria bacterium UBA11159]HBS67924.1 VWA domain-containing protein [Cyanobacteria bacterium UBA11153]HBW87505.1 VWA domain-containing protein [Cyanobacteria bacterium UBA11149]
MTTNSIALFFMTDFSIPKPNHNKALKTLAPPSLAGKGAGGLGFSPLIALAAILLNLAPTPAIATTVKIDRWSTTSDRVTLKVKVLNNNRIPILGLEEQAFRVKTKDKFGNPHTLQSPEIRVLSPEESHPQQTYVAILLDMSGSMKQKDTARVKKLDGAVNAIRGFINLVKAENLPVDISIIPFGEGCNHSYQVTTKTIEDNFKSASNSELEKQLDELAKVPVCAATNIYQPLTETVKYLRNRFPPSPSEIDAQDKPLPKLSVILLSDGFHVYRNNEPQQFENVINLLKQNSQITVHTLGYGESLAHLRNRAICFKYIPDDRLTVDDVANGCRLPGSDIQEFIVDEDRLKKIAQTTGGIHEFPEDAEAVAKSLKTFFTTLREYEIIYQQPGSDRATIHPTKIEINSPDRGINTLQSETENIRMSNFIYRALTFTQRLPLLILTVFIGLVGVLPFIQWSKKLKQQSDL